MEQARILCIVGPTACHKTELAVLLSKRFGGEVVSADSVQVYIGMDVGSAKPTIEERQGVPHHMIDCLPIDTPAFSVSTFREMALSAIDDVLARGRLPVIAGGSGLYVHALISPLNFAIPSDAAVRAQLSEFYDASPAEAFQKLLKCDPQSAALLHPNDKKRVVRALEVYAVGGKPLSSYGNDFSGAQSKETQYHPVMIGLTMERNALYARIDARVEHMLRNGLREEAEHIYHAGYDRTLPAMQSIGYRQLFEHFDGELSFPEAIEQIKRETRRFAKRQLTWFTRDTRIHWFDVTNWSDTIVKEIYETAEEQLQ